jgi:hypothetical protein
MSHRFAVLHEVVVNQGGERSKESYHKHGTRRGAPDKGTAAQDEKSKKFVRIIDAGLGKEAQSKAPQASPREK